jgi:hypothetical protein
MPLEPMELQSKTPKIYGYVVENRKVIESQSATSLNYRQGYTKKGEKHFYSLGKVGNYTFAPHIVVYRDNTDMGTAAVLQRRVAPWGDEIVPVPEKHAAIISQTNENYYHNVTGLGIDVKDFRKLSDDAQEEYVRQEERDITEDEAYYVCAILNSPITKLYFQISSDARGISKERVVGSIKLPLYNPDNEVHVNLMGIARKATGQGHATDDQLKSLDENYLALCSDIGIEEESATPKKN